MTSRKAKSRKLSSTKKSNSKLLDKTVFFVDRSSGRYKLSSGLRNLGLMVETHDDHFPQNVADVEWISVCSERDWVIISSDKAIKKNVLERQAIMSSSAAAFFFTSASITSDTQLTAFESALSKVTHLLLNQKRPFIARISPDGSVELWLNHKGEDLIAQKLEQKKNRRK
jgi:PIN like domain